MSDIVLDAISKRFADGTEALQRTDLTIRDGEFFIVVGPSGCGKSTLLNIIVGLEQPSTGEVLVGGERVTAKDPKDRNMAMVFQSYAIYPHMTVRENMAFPLRLAKLDEDEIARRVQHAAGILELGELLERRPAALSGGQRQRVAMGRAIVRQPAAFLLDEPLSNLDAKLRVQMRIELARLQRRLGTTTVYVTHDQTEAMTLGDRIALLRRGRVQQVGSPRELYARPANLFVAGFIGSPAMNFLPAQVEAGRLRLPMLEMPLPERFRARIGEGRRSLIAGIRPEHFFDAGRVPVSSDQRLTVTVEMVEWLGADLYVHFDLPRVSQQGLDVLPDGLELDAVHGDRLRLIARIEAANEIAEGQTIELGIDPDRLSLFDAQTGERIYADDESADV